MQKKLEDFKSFKPVIESMIQPKPQVKKQLRIIPINKKARRRPTVKITTNQKQQTIEIGFTIMKKRLINSKKRKRYAREISKLKSDQSNYTGTYWKATIVIE